MSDGIDQPPDERDPKAGMLRALLDQVIADQQSLSNLRERMYERQITYAGRLLFLDGATITLTFTALSAFGAKLVHGHGLSQAPQLFWAWSLLISAMILCIVAQRINLSTSVGSGAASHGRILMQRVGLGVGIVQAIAGPEVASTAPRLEDGLLETVEKKVNRWDRVHDWVLLAAEAFTVVAFVLLLFFMEANIRLMSA
ncbi:MAG: hypothetical protein WCA37_10740, partial [Terracidiphilus sp.]